MLSGLLRELNYLLKHKWDLCLVTLAPLFIIVLFSSMFAQGKPEHLPIAIIDQDQSELSQNIQRYLRLNHTLDVAIVSDQNTEVEKLLNQTKVWGYVSTPMAPNNVLFKLKMLKSALPITKVTLVWGTPFHQLCYSAQLKPWQTMLVKAI